MSKINQHFQITFKLPKVFELFKLVALVLFVAHLCGCGFHYVGFESLNRLDQEKNWIISQKIQNETWVHRYIYSIYFAIVTMVTIGYGDVYPTNIYERIYVIFMTLFSCGIFAYCINTIGNIFQEQSYKQKAFKQKLFDIQKYLQCRSINKEAQLRVFKYLEYLNEQTDEVLTKGQVTLSECSQDLQEEILKDYYGKILLNLKILQNNFSTDFIQALSIKMKEKRFGPGEVIIQQGNRSKYLYFLSNGDIEYYIQNGQKKKQILTLQILFIHLFQQNISKVFDFRLFITETASPYSIRTRLNTTMAYLTFEDFLSTLQEFKLDYITVWVFYSSVMNLISQKLLDQFLKVLQYQLKYIFKINKEKFCMIKDQFQYSDRFDNQCLSCGQYGHDIQDCSQIHFNRIARSPFQPRGKIKSVLIKQLQRNKVNCLKNLKTIKSDLKMLRLKYNQNTIDNFNNVSAHQLSQIYENDKDFYMNCPRIKIQVQKKEQNTLNYKEGCEIKIFDKENSSSSSSGSDSMDDSDFQSEGSQFAQQSNINQRLFSLIKTEILNLQAITEKEDQESIYQYKKRQSNTEKEMSKFSSRQSFSKNQEEVQQLIQKMNSINSPRDKKTNQNSAIFLDNDELDKNINHQIHNDIKRKVYQKKKQTISFHEEKHEGEVKQLLKKQLDDVLFKLDTIQKREEDHIPVSLQRTLKGSQQQTIADHSPTFNDSKEINHQQHISHSQDQLKNSKHKFQRREGVRRKQVKYPTLKRNENSNLSIPAAKQQPKEGYYENNDIEPNHIFGVLKFNFDKIKEFSLYYPKFNCSNIIKSFRKIYGKSSIEKNKNKKLLFFQNAGPSSDIYSQIYSNTSKIYFK